MANGVGVYGHGGAASIPAALHQPLARRLRFGLRADVAKKRSSPATRFLWVIAILTIIFLAGAIGYRLFEKELMR
jgi:hypothetical protein